jgi:hypothetical protein
MPDQAPSLVVQESIPVDVPEERAYETEEDAGLDRDLVDAIDSAQDAGDEYLAELLANELGNHYFSCR